MTAPGRLLATLILLAATPLAAVADEMSEAGQAGRDLGQTLILKPGSGVFTDDTVSGTVTPFLTEAPPESGLTGSAIEGAAETRAAGASPEAEARKAEIKAATDNPRTAMTASDPVITTADQLNRQAEDRAGDLFSATGSDGTVCTTEGLGSAGPIERSCERSVSVDTFSCRMTLDVEVTRQDLYDCDVTYGADGEVTDECRALTAAPECLQTSSACLNLGADGQCVSERRSYSCLNNNGDLSPARLVQSGSTDIAETTAETCDPAVQSTSCAAEEPRCIAGPETRIINGVPITRDCWAWDKAISCQVAGTNSDCALFEREPNCHRIQSDCLAWSGGEDEDGNGLGSCVHWEDRYRCEAAAGAAGQNCDRLTVCAGGYCETVEPEPANTGYGLAATWLNVMNEMAKDAQKDLESQEIKVFNGKANSCRVGALGVLNCCKDSGWGNGIIGSCTSDEYDLIERNAAEATHYIGTYCSKRFFVCLQKKRVYCQFNSKLARIFIEEMRHLTGVSWGTAKVATRTVWHCNDDGEHCTIKKEPVAGTGPNCVGATIEEMETIDMEQIDLSEAFEDFVSDAAIPAAAMIQDFLISRVGSN